MNPYVIIAALVSAIGLFGSGAYLGYDYAQGEAAFDQLKAAEDAAVQIHSTAVANVEAARQSLEAEQKRALSFAAQQQERQVAALNMQHQLELELAHDEAARTCSLSPGAFGVLSRAFKATGPSADGAQSKAGGLNGGVPTATPAGDGKPR